MEGRISKVKAKKRTVNIIIFTVLALGSILMLYPFVWMIFTSFKPKLHVYIGGLLPQVWTTESYTQIWGEIDLVRGFLNTILYSIPPVIIGSLVSKIFGSNGPINNLLTQMGGQPVNFLMDEGNWVVMYVVTGIWQSAGWGTIIYLAAISGVNTELYEAAEVDGCGRLRRIWYVTLPCIMPTIVIMLILRLGQMVGIGFERPYVMMNKMVTNSADVISTFVYDRGILNRQYPFATAVDIFGSVVNMCFVIGANMVTRRMGEGGLF